MRYEPNIDIHVSDIHIYTLTSKPMKGDKGSNNGTLCNCTGDIEIKLFVVAKARRPCCFRSDFNPEIDARYRDNKRAWLTT